MRSLSLILLILVGVQSSARAQNCPEVALSGSIEKFYVRPIGAGGPSVTVYSDGGIELSLFHDCDGQLRVNFGDTDQIAHYYGFNTYLDPASGRFNKELFFVANRVRRKTGEDVLNVARFNADNKEDNFLLEVEIFTNPLDPREIVRLDVLRCDYAPSVTDFNSRYLNATSHLAVASCSTTANKGAVDDHNSLYHTSVACWDLNSDFACNLVDEDITGDGICDVRDCRGPIGPQGTAGKDAEVQGLVLDSCRAAQIVSKRRLVSLRCQENERLLSGGGYCRGRGAQLLANGPLDEMTWRVGCSKGRAAANILCCPAN